MLSDYLIIGTDAGVGKTYVTCALLRDLRRRGFNAMGYKPICCGDRAEARAIREVTEPGISLELINPLYLRANAEPAAAAELQRVTIDPQQLVEGYRKLKAAGYGPIIIEGVGGWLTPIAEGGYTMAELARDLALPILLVVNNQQGAANLVSLTTMAIRQSRYTTYPKDSRALRCEGVILNHPGEDWDTAAVTNRKLIEDFAGMPVVAELINAQDELDSESILKFDVQQEEGLTFNGKKNPRELGPGLRALLARKKGEH